MDTGEEVLADEQNKEQPDAATSKQKVRPIQMGEFLRKWVSRRLLKLNTNDIQRIMISLRQLGVGMSGGAEAFAISISSFTTSGRQEASSGHWQGSKLMR